TRSSNDRKVEAPRVHHPARRRGSRVAARGAHAADRADAADGRAANARRKRSGNESLDNGLSRGAATAGGGAGPEYFGRLAVGWWRWLKSYATELLGMAPDVLFCQGVPALLALHHETRSLPIVFVQVSDPVGLGFVANLARPSGNVTGFTNFEHAIGSKWLELIKDTVPGVTRVEVIFDPENPLQFPYVQAIEAATPSFGVELILAGVRNAAEIERAIDAFAHSKGAIIVLPSFVTLSHRDLIIALTARYALPAIYSYRVFTSGGGFISYGVDLADAYRRAAVYVDLILKGAKPGDLPVQLPTKFELVVNLKT